MAGKETAFSRIEKGVRKEEKKILSEIKKEERSAVRFLKSHTFRMILVTAIFIVLVGGILYLAAMQDKVYIEKSLIQAPVISLSPASPGILEKVLVKEGDLIPPNTVVAQVSGNQIRSEIGGLVISVQDTPGQIVSSQTPVVQMIDPEKLRVVGSIEEDKGLKDIKVGQKVIFTVDAFGSRQYEGIVDSISPTSRQSDIVFSISDQRQENEFDVKARFDTTAYPELKNGMSAKMWVYK